MISKPVHLPLRDEVYNLGVQDRLGFITDLHGNAEMLRSVLESFEKEGVGHVLVCGDLETPETYQILRKWEAEGAGRKVRGVLGNHDLLWTEAGGTYLTTEKNLLQIGSDELDMQGITVAQNVENMKRLLHNPENRGLKDWIQDRFGHSNLVVSIRSPEGEKTLSVFVSHGGLAGEPDAGVGKLEGYRRQEEHVKQAWTRNVDWVKEFDLLDVLSKSKEFAGHISLMVGGHAHDTIHVTRDRASNRVEKKVLGETFEGEIKLEKLRDAQVPLQHRVVIPDLAHGFYAIFRNSHDRAGEYAPRIEVRRVVRRA